MLKKDLGLFLLIVVVSAVVAYLNPRFISGVNLSNTANLIGLPTIGISPSMLEVAEGGSGVTAFTFTVARSGNTGSTS